MGPREGFVALNLDLDPECGGGGVTTQQPTRQVTMRRLTSQHRPQLQYSNELVVGLARKYQTSQYRHGNLLKSVCPSARLRAEQIYIKYDIGES
jgi:hypothetical protein